MDALDARKVRGAEDERDSIVHLCGGPTAQHVLHSAAECKCGWECAQKELGFLWRRSS